MMKDPNNTRNTAPRRGSPLWIYLTLVTVLGLGLLGAATVDLGTDGARVLAGGSLFWILLTLIVIGELRPLVTPGGEAGVVTTSATFAFAGLLYWGLPTAALMQVLACVAAGLANRRAVHRVLFNGAQYTVSLAVATLTLLPFGITAKPADPWVPDGVHLVPVGLAAVVYFLANNLFVSGAVTLYERSSLIKTVRSGLPYQALVHIALLSLSPLVVVVMDRSALLVPLFVLPFIAVYLNAAISVHREHQALHDGLTGLPNRKLLVVRTEEALAVAKEQNRQVALFLLDLDRFKEVNDTLGHPTGDRLLQLVAHRLTHSVRPGDIVARLGGDEFAVLLPSVRNAQAAREVAARLRAALNEPVRLEGMSFDLEASVGIALHPDHAPDYELLLQRADVAMYVAKERRSGVEIYAADKDRNSATRLGMLGDLRRAVDRDELELHYQPKVSLVDGRLVGLEALIRWRHPERGLVLPEEFLPLAEQTYLMRTITHLVVDGAVAQAAMWWHTGLSTQVAINVSARDLLDSTLTDTIAGSLLRHDVPPGVLQLEITERILMTEPAYAADTVQAIAQLGIPLSLDDFGTGYSSLVRLRRLPVEEIKIDSSFVGLLGESSDDAVVVQSIIDLVRALDLRSVAEGVESARVARTLLEMGCDAGQGWHFGQPMDAATATSLIHRHASRGHVRPARTEAAG